MGEQAESRAGPPNFLWTYLKPKTKWPPVKQRRRQDQKPALPEPQGMSMLCSTNLKSKEAFTMMDANRDGFIDKDDLMDTYASLGRTLDGKTADAMLAESSGPINFQVFLGMFGDKISGTDPEETINAAFKTLDPESDGAINTAALKAILCSQADKFDAKEFQDMLGISTVDGDKLDYKGLAYTLTHGQADE